MEETEPKIQQPYHSIVEFGVPAMDAEHKELVNLLNQVSSLVFNKTEDATVVRLLNKLIEKTVLHFANEEVLIKQYCAPDDAALHIAKHASGLSTLIALKNKLELDLIKYQIRYTSDMSNFTEHLFSYDAALANLINNKVAPLKSSGSGRHRIIEIE